MTPAFTQQGTAYVDSSALLSVALREPSASLIARRLESFRRLASADLLEAETRSAFARYGMDLAGARK